MNVPEPHSAASRSYAGFWIRFAALLIDQIVLVIGIVVLARIFGGALSQGPRLLGMDLVVPWLYYAGMESSAQQATLGDRKSVV